MKSSPSDIREAAIRQSRYLALGKMNAILEMKEIGESDVLSGRRLH
jgi:hypothetical protein